MSLQRRTLVLTVLSILLVAGVQAPVSGRSPALPEAYTRLLEDCQEDYGFRTGRAHELGHDILALDATEGLLDGDTNQPVMRFRLSYQYATGAVSNLVPNRNLIAFDTPRGSLWTLLDTTMTTLATFVGGVEPATMSQDQFVNFGQGSGRHVVVEFTYRYHDLQVENGDILSNFTVLGYYSPTMPGHVPDGVGIEDWRKADLAPGGFYLPDGELFEGCWNAAPTFDPADDLWYQPSKDFTVAQSNWRPPELPNTPPVADFSFTPSSPVERETVRFTDLSSDVDGFIEAWRWDFGDGNVSANREPFHQYAQSGQYTVVLNVTDNDGTTAEKSSLIVVAPETVNEPPVADFTFEPEAPRVGEEVQFTSLSYDPDGQIVAWEWGFGDGNTSELEHPTHRFNATGDHTVLLLVTDDRGHVGLLSRVVEVWPPGAAPAQPKQGTPRAAFHVPTQGLVAGQWVQFTDLSVHPTGNITSWVWDFGDGRQSTLKSPKHVFAEPGAYRVTLEVGDEAGQSNATFRDVNVQAPTPDPPQDEPDPSTDTSTHQSQPKKPPVVKFTVNHGTPMVGNVVRFTDGSTDPDGVIVERWWDFGDGRTSTTTNPVHVYREPGTYVVRLRVTDNDGMQASSELIVMVTPHVLEADTSSDPEASTEDAPPQEAGTQPGEAVPKATAAGRAPDDAAAAGAREVHHVPGPGALPALLLLLLLGMWRRPRARAEGQVPPEEGTS